jgi:HECT-domain (ubiquitin-transferase)
VLPCVHAATDQLSLLLIFATGSESIPALGFDNQPSLTFGHVQALDFADLTREYPVANTCGLSLRLPIVDDYETFKDRMLAAITMVLTFTSG